MRSVTKNIVIGSFILYLAAWNWHLFTGTAALRGFWGDGALEFLIHLSRSYMFGYDSSWVHLFWVKFPRDGGTFLNALGLQAALFFGIHSPAALKYIFVFWQYASPGYIYLVLIYILWRQKRLAWAVFPLLSWAVPSVAVDWNAVNDTRWAVPVFWIFLYQVFFARARPGALSYIGLSLSAALMLAGLYESVIAIAALAMTTGAVIWLREKNNRPFLYSLVALPGALRAAVSLVTIGHNAPNNFQTFIVPAVFPHPYALMIILSLLFAPLIALTPEKRRVYLYAPVALVWTYIATQIWLTPMLQFWTQIQMRFDYIALSFVLMMGAALCRCLSLPPGKWAAPASIMGLVTGALLWVVQATDTQDWNGCMADYAATRGDKPLILADELQGIISPREGTHIIDRRRDWECLWDWTAPWTDMLLAPDGKVTRWPLYTFWQDFSFIHKEGQIFMHTNNWTLTSPSFEPSEEDLPLKTPLYDLTPLYQEVGEGDLFPRTACMPVESTGAYWQKYLMMSDDDTRETMHTCPR